MTDILQRITSEFVEREDRLRVRGALADGQVAVLWLTQRLLNRALPPLIEWLDKQPSPELAAAGQAPAGGAPSAPVVERGGELHHLIDQLDLGFGNSGVRLTFSSTTSGTLEPVGAMILGAAALGQWLEILLRQYRKGQWPETAWGDWPKSNQISASAHQSLTVH